jgi:hypothetical protein
MKTSKIPPYLMFSLLFLLCSCFGLQAQTVAPQKGSAVADKVGKVMIQQGPLCYQNALEISTMDFPSQEKALEHFAKKNSQLVTFELDQATGALTFRIELRAQPDWKLEDWNAYLSSLK